MALCKAVILPGEFRLLLLVLTLGMVIGSLYFTKRIQGSIRWKYNRHYEAYRRKTNPCFHCPRPRKYVCDGCYVKLRKEYEDGRRNEVSKRGF